MMWAAGSIVPEGQPEFVRGGPAATKVYVEGKDANENEIFISRAKFKMEEKGGSESILNLMVWTFPMHTDHLASTGGDASLVGNSM